MNDIARRWPSVEYYVRALTPAQSMFHVLSILLSVDIAVVEYKCLVHVVVAQVTH